MSKSKRNTVDPQQMVDRYGADTARLFVLFAAPPERDLEWNEDGVIGSHRFLKRLWTLVHEHLAALVATPAFAGKARDCAGPDQLVVRKIHQTIKRATDAMERDFAFNTTIAACMELMNELDPARLSPAVFKLGVTTLLRLLAPMAPHICAELWQTLGSVGDLDAAGWPSFDEAETLADEVDYPIQVSGKLRGRIGLARSLLGAELDAAVLAHPEVVAIIGGRPVRKLIVVPGKIINLVLG